MANRNYGQWVPPGSPNHMPSKKLLKFFLTAGSIMLAAMIGFIRYLSGTELALSVLFMDIDNFKRINDHFGHHIGDRLLCSVAKTIKNNIRAIDLIARFGGDEFGILLSETDAESAALVVSKLKKKLINVMETNGWPVTFSIGVATFRSPPDSIIEMINAADTQMYLAKQNGKNQIQSSVIFEENNVCGSIGNSITGVTSL